MEASQRGALDAFKGRKEGRVMKVVDSEVGLVGYGKRDGDADDPSVDGESTPPSTSSSAAPAALVT